MLKTGETSTTELIYVCQEKTRNPFIETLKTVIEFRSAKYCNLHFNEIKRTPTIQMKMQSLMDT